MIEYTDKGEDISHEMYRATASQTAIQHDDNTSHVYTHINAANGDQSDFEEEVNAKRDVSEYVEEVSVDDQLRESTRISSFALRINKHGEDISEEEEEIDDSVIWKRQHEYYWMTHGVDCETCRMHYQQYGIEFGRAS